YGPGSSGKPQRLSDFGVGSSLTGRNSAQMVPHAVLEWSAARVEADVRPGHAVLEAGADPIHPFAEPARVRHEPGIGQLAPELGFECGIGIAQKQRTHAAFSCP